MESIALAASDKPAQYRELWPQLVGLVDDAVGLAPIAALLGTLAW